MKRNRLALCLLAAATLLLHAACGKTPDLLDKVDYNLVLSRWDGEQTVRYWVYHEDAKPAIRALKKVKASATEDWLVGNARLPFYGIECPTADGWGMDGLWTNGYWIDDEGNAWIFDFDFEQLIADTQWHGEPKVYEGMQLPCIRYLAQEGDHWNVEYLEPAPVEEPPADISLALQLQEAGELVATVKNNGAAEWLYGADWHLEVLVEENWYVVPTRPGNWAFSDIGCILPAGESREETFYLREDTYGDLPPGQYRLAFYGLTAEFTLE